MADISAATATAKCQVSSAYRVGPERNPSRAPGVLSAMETFLLIWVVSSAAIFAAALIVTSDKPADRPGSVRIAFLAAFWPPIIVGLLVSFLCWCAQKAVSAKVSAPGMQ